MRTTLDIDDDLLRAARQIAQQRKITAGKVVSSLLCGALHPESFKLDHRNGLPILPRMTNVPSVTAELVDRLESESD